MRKQEIRMLWGEAERLPGAQKPTNRGHQRGDAPDLAAENLFLISALLQRTNSLDRLIGVFLAS